MPTLLPLLLETDFVMHSANGDAKMSLSLSVGVSLSLYLLALMHPNIFEIKWIIPPKIFSPSKR